MVFAVLLILALSALTVLVVSLLKPSDAFPDSSSFMQRDEETGEKKTFHAIAAPFPPFTDPDSPDYGYVWEIAKAAFESQGYEVTLSFSPWGRALTSAIDGQYDGLLPAYWTEERSEWFLFPSPVAVSHIGFLKRHDRDDIEYKGNLRDLSGYDIGVGRGYSTSPEFDSADYLSKIEVATTPQILKMLWLERLDLAVGGIEYSIHYLEEINDEPDFDGIRDNIIVIKPELNSRDIFLAISKKTPLSEEKLADFNKGLEEIRRNGIYNQILQKAGF